jgi:hypothetical protein
MMAINLYESLSFFPQQPNAPLHLPPTLARLLPKTRVQAASERAHTRAEGGQVEAVVGWLYACNDFCLHQLHKYFRLLLYYP